tara:strand:- start:8594 stop:8911 length:318 start_codon:yes stop_codon:yes gene_type:complete
MSHASSSSIDVYFSETDTCKVYHLVFHISFDGKTWRECQFSVVAKTAERAIEVAKKKLSEFHFYGAYQSDENTEREEGRFRIVKSRLQGLSILNDGLLLAENNGD